MEYLLLKSTTKIEQVSDKFKRYLFKEINRKSKLVSIKGARGTGKTTLLLQLGKEQSIENVLYVAIDDLFFTENTLYELAEEFYKIGGKLLLLDEVHKYPNWSREIKLIYDDFAELRVIFTSSSILDIYKGESDLSRRAISYSLNEMSFREFLLFNENIQLPVFSFNEILNNHTEISFELTKQFRPFKYFSKYLKYGSYPYYEGNKLEYYQKVQNTINLILDIDLHSIENIDYNNIAKIKRLIFVIASNVPFIPNISKLSEQIKINRNALVQAIQLLERAELVHSLYKQSRSISSLNKPDKIWLHNTNLNYAISQDSVNTGNIRETFLLQNLSTNHKLSLPVKGDFYVDNKYILEVGGKNKTRKQITGIAKSYIVKDDVEIGVLNNIPLWLFGFLY
ncbi:MAG: ATP-binding protein [Chlorobi bacterium]|nr:ATP-binding protein [Chlorobiota bacterium]